MVKPLALTMGEPAGIGGEIALKSWLRRAEIGRPFFLIDDVARLKTLAGALSLDVPVAEIATSEQAAENFPHVLPVLHRPVKEPVRTGHPSVANAGAVCGSIEEAVNLARAGKVAGVVTNPIHKPTLHAADFAYPGHTEFISHLCNVETSVMMLAVPGLRVVPVTIHLPLRDVAAALNTEKIFRAGEIAAAALIADFGIAAPRLAVAALNPHAGDEGHIGQEEIDIIAPAVRRLRAARIDATGPQPADTLFHPKARTHYDAALCMYHDQALIPLKTIDFQRGVNITLGLPIVRTSPDHGTAFDIAGTGRADPASLMEALRLAGRMSDCRYP
jgi:4-hydroxythreonine-4-phosphate dehydrogenase